MTDFQAFMEVFTATHLTYVCIIPFFLSIVALVLGLASQLMNFNASNLYLAFFIALFMILSFGKVARIINSTSYIEKRMDQFQFIDDKVKSLEY